MPNGFSSAGFSSARQDKRARALGAEIDRLLAGEAARLDVSEGGAVDDLSLAPEWAVARRLSGIVASFPPVPAGLERRVREIVQSPPVGQRFAAGRRRSLLASAVGTAALSALATALVLLGLLFVLPGLSGGQRSWADVMDVFLGQTRVRVTPTLQAGSTLARPSVGAASLTPQAGRAPEQPGLPHREPLRDLVAAELLIGRAPSIPKALPKGYALLEIAAVSYPDLPSWISQPFYVELCYGPDSEGAEVDLRLRQYRLLFRELGGISGVNVAGEAVRDMEQVDVGGATGMLLTLEPQNVSASGGAHPTFTVLWERDGLLLELETDSLSQERLLEIARSVR